MTLCVHSTWLPEREKTTFELSIPRRSGPIFQLFPHSTMNKNKWFTCYRTSYKLHPKFLNDLQCCIRVTSIILPNNTWAESELHVCIQMQASVELCAQNSLWMGARQHPVWLWLCQITTCLHGDKTWNSAAWFACVSYRMHNASRAWIIYINKWRESVWCSANPFLFYFHLKGCFFFLFVKIQNKPPYWRDRWQTGWNWVSYPKSHCDGNGGCHGNQEVEQFVGLPWEDVVVTWRTHKVIHICKCFCTFVKFSD